MRDKNYPLYNKYTPMRDKVTHFKRPILGTLRLVIRYKAIRVKLV
jgi:hypothetical protein